MGHGSNQTRSTGELLSFVHKQRMNVVNISGKDGVPAVHNSLRATGNNGEDGVPAVLNSRIRHRGEPPVKTVAKSVPQTNGYRQQSTRSLISP